MSVSYVSAGSSPTAAQLNALTAELDVILRMLLSGKSWLVWPGNILSVPEGKRFYFGSGTRRILSAITTVYDHTDYTTAAAAYTVWDRDATLMLSYVDEPVWDLDDSLEVHTETFDGDTYWLMQKSESTGALGSRERYRRLDVAEIIMEGMSGDLTWDSAWTKYHFLRFHNLDDESRDVVLPGSVTITIPPFGIKAVRRTYPAQNTWDQTYTYLWRAVSGDQLCLFSNVANNVGSMNCFHAWLDWAILGSVGNTGVRKGANVDPSICWNGASLLPATITGSTRLGELFWHLGEILAFDDADTTGTAMRDTPASWTELESASGVAGVKAVISGSGALTIEAASGTTAPVDAMGLSTTILPVMPDTLPYAHTSYPDTIDPVFGVATGTDTIEVSYTGGDPPDSIEVSTSHWTAGISTGWANAGTPHAFSTLTSVADMSVDPTGEQTTQPAIQWASDGWRLIWYAEREVDPDWGYVPSTDYTDIADITATSITFHVGDNLFSTARPGWMHSHERHARKLSPYVGYVDAFDVVYHTGHPDIDGTEGLPSGEDWSADRGTPTSSVVARTELLADSTETRTLPVIPCNDAADRISANADTAGWYTTNRGDLIAGVTETSDRQKVIRVPLLRQHYNHVAQRLNSIVSVRPFDFRDLAWYEAIDDGTVPSEFDAFPYDYYCAALSSGSRAADIGITVSSQTIEFREPYDLDPGLTQTLYYIEMADLGAWCDSVGIPLLIERIAYPYRLAQTAGEPQPEYALIKSDDVTDNHALFGETACVAKHIIDATDGSLWAPTIGQDFTLCHEVKWQQFVYRNVTTPTGWTFDDESKLLTKPTASIGYESTAYEATPDATTVREVVSEEDLDGKLWDPASLDGASGEIDANTIATAYGTTLADDRAAITVQQLHRLIYVRS